MALDTLKVTDIAEDVTIENASNEAFHRFALRAFSSVKNTEPKDWQDRYLRWIAVNKMLTSGRVIRKKKANAAGWQLIIVSESSMHKSEEKASTDKTGSEVFSSTIEGGNIA